MTNETHKCPICHTQQFDGECAHCATKAEMGARITPKTEHTLTPPLIVDWNQLWIWANGKGLDFDTMAERQAFTVRAVTAYDKLKRSNGELLEALKQLANVANQRGMDRVVVASIVERAWNAISRAEVR